MRNETDETSEQSLKLMLMQAKISLYITKIHIIITASLASCKYFKAKRRLLLFVANDIVLKCVNLHITFGVHNYASELLSLGLLYLMV